MSNPRTRRKRLQKMHAEQLPVLDYDETEAIVEETRSLDCDFEYIDEGAVSFAELNQTMMDSRNNKASKHVRMKEDESIEMERNGNVPQDSDHFDGTNRRKRTLCRWSSQYFSDGKRLIDFVLVYENRRDGEEDKDVDPEDPSSPPSSLKAYQRHALRRAVFEENLRNLGLELEYASASALHRSTTFVLVHAPFKVLMRQAELLQIRCPVHRNDVRKEVDLTEGFINACLKRLKFLDFSAQVKKRIEPEMYFCQPFVVQHLDCFVGYENPDTFFSRADRARMTWDLLIRARYDSETTQGGKSRFGVEKLIRSGTYSAAYPLQEELNRSATHVDFEKCTDRQLLYETWVKFKNTFKYQPLDLIRNYYGTKIGFYFAWLGYYTRCLYPVSLLGIFVVIYGLFTINQDIPSNDICNSARGIGAEKMCPVCPKCEFEQVSATCLYTRLTYLFDNYATIFFAAFMSVWTTLYLEGWKRYHAELAYRWNVLGYEPDEEVMRPEFQFQRKKMSKLNPVTKQREPYIPLMEKFLRLCGSAVTVVFFILLILALLVGVIAYRMIIRFYLPKAGKQEERLFNNLVMTFTSAMINLVFILIMNYFYTKLAFKLTNWECPRTQSEFDNSFTFKVFLFQFVNFYSSLFYIAFVKGRFVGVPGKEGEHADGQTIALNERCEEAGCMVELVIQLAIIMLGKQIINAFIELGYPLVTYWFRRWKLRLPETKKQREERINKEKRKTIKEHSGVSSYEQDYSLNPVSQQFLFDEYLEMVIQLGFVTLFVAAFPLAPLFALINNILEIRLDAYKFVLTSRRPVPEQARNIGIWSTIINMISNLAVLCNAFVIAFTSDFIPKFYYMITQESLHGYADDTFAYLDVNHMDARYYPMDTHGPRYCRYLDYRMPPCTLRGVPNVTIYEDSSGPLCSNEYEFHYKWWVILTFRLVFVLVFMLVVLSIKAIFAYLIPDVPTKIVIQLQRERYLMRQAILQRRDSPEVTDQTGPADEDEEEGRPDRPELDESWRGSKDVNEVAYQPGMDLPDVEPEDDEGQQRMEPRRSTDANFDGLKKMFSQRGMPSLSPRASVLNLSTIDMDDEGQQQDKTHSSDPTITRKSEKSAPRWPTPSLLVVPPSSIGASRPRTVEVLQRAALQLQEKNTDRSLDEGPAEKRQE